MLKNVVDLPSDDFGKGLNTVSDIFNLTKDQTPNAMNVKFNFDGSIEKRMGSTTQNTTALGGAAAQGFNQNASNLTNGLVSFWNLDEASGTREDAFGSNNLTSVGNVIGTGGLIGNAAFYTGNGQGLVGNAQALSGGNINWSLSAWFNMATTGQRTIVSKRDIATSGGGGIDANTVLMLHLDSDFTDSSSSAHTVSANGNAAISSAQSKFGGASCIFDGSGDFLSAPDSADWDFGTGDFCIDFWCRFNGAPSGNRVFFERGSSGSNDISIARDNDGTIRVYLGGVQQTSQAFAFSGDVWYHIAVSRSGTDLRLFVDGTQLGSTVTNSTDITFTTAIRIGADDSGNEAIDGFIDEFRISKGAARFTANFTPPTSAYGSTSIPGTEYEWWLYVDTDNQVTFNVSGSGTISTGQIKATSFGAVSTATWYNAVAYYNQVDSQIAVGVNLSMNSASYTNGIRKGSAPFIIGSISDGTLRFDGRVDMVGYWTTTLGTTNRSDLFAGGTGNQYSAAVDASTWGSFDFGAGANGVRWYTLAAGSAILASSNLGRTFATIASSQTRTWHNFERSKNVLIAANDAYDPVLYWAGSTGTFAARISSNAPAARFPINFQGFLILLNTSTRKRGFYYEDENSQLTGVWDDQFDLPSSADDEITGAFILNRRLYVSTRYKIFLVSYVGGNPDWRYEEARDFGYVPRTIKKIYLEGVGEVVVGMTWDRRLRAYDGENDKIISDNVENDNGMCDFALNKVSYAGSGLLNYFAEYDTNEQVYKICVAIGANSQSTTHFLCLNRKSAFYPYSNMNFSTMVMAESANQRFLLAAGQDGFVYKMDNGNLDRNVTRIDDVFDSPFLFDKSPSEISKTHKIDLYFSVNSAGQVYYFDRSNFYSDFSLKRTFNVGSSNAFIQHKEKIDIPMSQNVYQYRLTSSSGNMQGWRLNRVDFFGKGLGIG